MAANGMDASRAVVLDDQLWHKQEWQPPVSICSMPHEVLSTILKLGKSLSEDELEDENDQGGLPFEVLVSHIDAHFRRVALNTNSLWTSIRIAPERCMNEVATYIKRSGNCKLDIQLTSSHATLEERTKGMVTLILPHSTRWRTFYYRSVSEVRDNTLLSCLVDASMPMLEELSLSIDKMDNFGSTTVGHSFQWPILANGAPMLSFVRLRGFAIYSLLPPLATVRILHLDQTKSLALRNPGFHQAMTASQGLEHLSIYGDMVADSTWPSAENVIRFPQLVSLRVYDAGGQAYARLLLGFDTPVLNALALIGAQDHDLDRLWSIEDPSKFSNLRRLTVDFDLLAGDWRRAFILFPGVTSFSSYSYKGNLTILRLLAEPCINTLPWPHLKSLSFLFDVYDEDQKISITRAIDTRWMCGYPLTLVRLAVDEDDTSLQNYVVNGATKIEYFRKIDKWPLNRDFRDWDDNLF